MTSAAATYVITEPDAACSDATNVRLSIQRDSDSDSYVLNGQKVVD